MLVQNASTGNVFPLRAEHGQQRGVKADLNGSSVRRLPSSAVVAVPELITYGADGLITEMYVNI